MQFEITFFEKRRIWKDMWRAFLNTEGSNDLSKKNIGIEGYSRGMLSI